MGMDRQGQWEGPEGKGRRERDQGQNLTLFSKFYTKIWFESVKVLETAVGAIFAPTRFSLVRISIRDLVADGKSLVRNSGVGDGGEILILMLVHSTLHSENIARAQKMIEELFSEGLREIVAIDCVKEFLGNCMGGDCAILLLLSAFLLFFCMLPGVDLRKGHVVIAPKYFWWIISGWIARTSRNHCTK